MPIQRRLALKLGADDDDRVVLAAPVALVEDLQVVARNRGTDRVLERGLADGHRCRPSECRLEEVRELGRARSDKMDADPGPLPGLWLEILFSLSRLLLQSPYTQSTSVDLPIGLVLNL
jgi:hypothetical protein